MPIAKIAEQTGLRPATVSKALDTLGDMGIVKEITGKKRNRLFAYEQYVRVLSDGTDPLKR